MMGIESHALPFALVFLFMINKVSVLLLFVHPSHNVLL